MNLRTLVTVFGLLLAVFGFVRTEDEYDEYNLTLSDWTILDNGALEAYRRLARSRESDNVFLAPIPTVLTLRWKYLYQDEPELNEFFDTFDADQNRERALMKYHASQIGDEHILEFCSESIYGYREDCDDPGNFGAWANFEERFRWIVFATFDKLIPLLEQWYRDVNFDVKFDKTEFGEKACGIIFHANYFRHTWQQHDRCDLQSKFFFTNDSFKDGVKYTYMHSDLRYGELPTLKAKYIAVPWINNKHLSQFFELYVILPDTVDGLAELEMRITDTEVQKMINETGRSAVQLSLPEIRMTRKYRPLPIIKNVSEEVNNNEYNDWITVVGFDAFRSTAAYSCLERRASTFTNNPDVRRFNANHPFLLLLAQKTPLPGRSRIAGILGYRTAEQAE